MLGHELTLGGTSGCLVENVVDAIRRAHRRGKGVGRVE